jgi:hypothetical protein
VSPAWPRTILLALAVAATGLGAEFAAAERGYYKWLDARGNPQHSDRPPPAGVEYEFVSTETGLRRRVENDEASGQVPPAPAVPAATRPARPAGEAQAAIEKDPEMCDKAKANLDTLNSTARVRIRDDDGIRYLTEDEKEVQRQRAQNLINIHCSSS